MPAALSEYPTVLDLAARRQLCTIDPESAFPTFFSGGVRSTSATAAPLRHVRVNSGAGERPSTPTAWSRKFLALRHPRYSRDNAERIRDAVLTLETTQPRTLRPCCAVKPPLPRFGEAS